jgi:ribosomal protein RSM22 (predicted rRNA methylase)
MKQIYLRSAGARARYSLHRSSRSMFSLYPLAKVENPVFVGARRSNSDSSQVQQRGRSGAEFDDIEWNNESNKALRYKPAILPEEDIPMNYYIDPLSGQEHMEEVDADDLDDDVWLDPTAETWKKILPLLRVKYRGLDPVPEWFKEKLNEISQHRTLPQIRRCLKSWMIKHDIQFLKRFLNRPFQYATTTDKSDTSPSIRYTYGPEETIAYTYYHMSSRYTITKRVLQELRLYTNNQFVPRKVLDFGCGPATAAAAISTVWPEESKNNIHYAGLEISQSMIDAAKITTNDLFTNATFWNKTSEVIQRALDKGDRYSLIICSYTLTELVNDETRRVAVQLLYELLEPNGFIVFLENGNPYGSHTVRTAREYLLHMNNTLQREGKFEQYHDHNFVPLTDAEMKEIDGEDDDDDEDKDFYLSDLEEDAELDKIKSQYKLIQEKKKKQVVQNAMKKLERRHERKKNAKIHQSRELTMILPSIKSFHYTDFQTKVIAPCTHDRECPMKKNSWCSFAQRVASGVVRKDGTEKYSYVVMQKAFTEEYLSSRRNNLQLENYPWISPRFTTNPLDNLPQQQHTSVSDKDGKESEDSNEDEATELFLQSTPLQILGKLQSLLDAEAALKEELLQKAANKKERQQVFKKKTHYLPELDNYLQSFEESQLDDYSPLLVRDEYTRLIRSPKKLKGHVIVDSCMPSGDMTRTIFTKGKMHKEMPAIYRMIRKSSWGGLLPAFFPVEKDSVPDRLEEQQESIKPTTILDRKDSQKLKIKQEFMAEQDKEERELKKNPKKLKEKPYRRNRKNLPDEFFDYDPMEDDNQMSEAEIKKLMKQQEMEAKKNRRNLMMKNYSDKDEDENEDEDEEEEEMENVPPPKKSVSPSPSPPLPSSERRKKRMSNDPHTREMEEEFRRTFLTKRGSDGEVENDFEGRDQEKLLNELQKQFPGEVTVKSSRPDPSTPYLAASAVKIRRFKKPEREEATIVAKDSETEENTNEGQNKQITDIETEGEEQKEEKKPKKKIRTVRW